MGTSVVDTQVLWFFQMTRSTASIVSWGSCLQWSCLLSLWYLRYRLTYTNFFTCLPPVVPLELLIFFFVILAYLNGDLIISFLHYKSSFNTSFFILTMMMLTFFSTYADCWKWNCGSVTGDWAYIKWCKCSQCAIVIVV